MHRLASIATSLPFRVLVTVVLLTVIAVSLDWDAVGNALADGAWGWFAAGVGALAVMLAIGAVRWHRLLLAAGLEVGLPATARAYWIGGFTNNFLPTGFGGDAARTLSLARRGPELARTVTSVFVDRVSSIACLLVIGVLATLFSSSVPHDLELVIYAAGAAALMGAVAALLTLRAHRFVELLPERLKPWAAEVRETLLGYERDLGLILVVVALGFAFQFVAIASTWMLAKSLELDLSYALIAVVLPLVLVATLFPISLAGFGVREGSFIVLLDIAGVSAADATLLSLFTVVGLALASLPGGLALLSPGTRANLAES